jgi:acetolactate synthase regulatory subunit
MHYLELRTDDVHAVLGRLMDRIRVSGLMLEAVEAARSHDGYAVTVCIGTEDAGAVERLSNAMAKVVGATLIGVGRARAHATGLAN